MRYEGGDFTATCQGVLCCVGVAFTLDLYRKLVLYLYRKLVLYSLRNIDQTFSSNLWLTHFAPQYRRGTAYMHTSLQAYGICANVPSIARTFQDNDNVSHKGNLEEAGRNQNDNTISNWKDLEGQDHAYIYVPQGFQIRKELRKFLP